MKIVIAGASGFIGKHLVSSFVGHEVIALQRSSKAILGSVTSIWDAKTPESCQSAIEKSDVVINLVGAPISLKWTEENKKLILDSRVESTEAIGQAIQRCDAPPKIWINASAMGYYGDTGERDIDETSPPGTDFLADVCKAWEASALKHDLSTKRAFMRSGMVLGKDGGALPTLAKLTKAFLGGAAGSGKQWVPWIHIEDLVGMFHLVIEKEWDGPMNGCSPNTVRNQELMAEVRKTLHRPWSPPVPAFMLGIVGKLGGPAPELTLNSCKATPSALKN